jgi:tRNA nucleotidyltransferase (CCA-adding enzyme)
MKIYQVGGCVRDALLGIPSKDIDYAVEASSYEEMVEYIKSHGKIFLESPQHLTVRAHMEGKQPADFVLCRKDGVYSDGRRPDSVEPGTLYDDLKRRDFTVNAIAFDEATGAYIDPFGGQEDLKRMELKCVGSAKERFTEDALRMLRALRFHITKGFKLDKDIFSQFCSLEMIKLLSKNISLDRKRDEMTKCFSFSTLKTIEAMHTLPASLVEAIFSGDSGSMWLMPTSKETPTNRLKVIQ